MYEIRIAAWRCLDARRDPRGGGAREAERAFAGLVRRTLAGAP